MGFISNNSSKIMQNNTRITLNAIKACVDNSISRLFLASSACVYPMEIQSDSSLSVKLSEDFAWPANPQDGYGLEKLYAEKLALYAAESAPTLEIRVARFHNIYGPRGTWFGGREKAPSAFLRKVIAISTIKEKADAWSPDSMPIEVWGDGQQRRSFLYIEDCVEAVLLLMNSGFSEALNILNIGSENDLTMKELSNLCCEIGDLPNHPIELNLDGPVGVASRTSDNTKILKELGWSPKWSLRDGLLETRAWIKEQHGYMAACMNDPAQLISWNESLLKSKRVQTPGAIPRKQFKFKIPDYLVCKFKGRAAFSIGK
jgi:nucleoside-diphosphate-sugar epimerase